MNLLFFFFIAAIAMALCNPAVRHSLRGACYRLSHGGARLAMNASTELAPAEHSLALYPDAAHSAGYIVKIGSDSDHYAVISAASDKPLGVVIDSAATADLTLRKRTVVQPNYHHPVSMVAGGTLVKGDYVYAKSDGTLVPEPGSAGTYWRIGRALAAATTGLPVPVALVDFTPFVVIANGASLATTQAALTVGGFVKVL